MKEDDSVNSQNSAFSNCGLESTSYVPECDVGKLSESYFRKITSGKSQMSSTLTCCCLLNMCLLFFWYGGQNRLLTTQYILLLTHYPGIRALHSE